MQDRQVNVCNIMHCLGRLYCQLQATESGPFSPMKWKSDLSFAFAVGCSHPLTQSLVCSRIRNWRSGRGPLRKNAPLYIGVTLRTLFFTLFINLKGRGGAREGEREHVRASFHP